MSVISKNQNVESWVTIQENRFEKLSNKFEDLTLKLDQASFSIKNTKSISEAKLKTTEYKSTIRDLMTLRTDVSDRIDAIYNRLQNNAETREFAGELVNDVLDNFEALRDQLTQELTEAVRIFNK